MKKSLLLLIFSFAFFSATYAQVAVKGIGSERVYSKKNATINLQVYPNPAVEFFSVTGSESVRRIEIYNLVGKKLKAFYASPDRKYEITDLDNGMYLAQFLDENGFVITTQRISKK